MLLGELVVVDAVDDGQIGAVGGGGDEHPLGAGGQMRRGLIFRGEDAGAFHGDVDAELLPRQGRGIPDRRYLDLAVADVDRVAVDLDLMGKTAVDGIEPQ